jgi:Na+/proline symporter
MELAGSVGRMEILDFDFDLNQRYTVWSGLTGGLFLALSYFGTDQSQVQRYLTGKNIKESRLGLMFNAVIKIPMQLFILFTGVLVFVFYLYQKPPAFFNETAIDDLKQTEYKVEIEALEAKYDVQYEQLQEKREAYELSLNSGSSQQIEQSKEAFVAAVGEDQNIRGEIKALLLKSDENFKVKDTNYVFLNFVMDYLPIGVIGLIIALIFSAAMSSTSGELNALATTTSVDFYSRLFNREASEKQQLWMSKLLTVFWGVLAISFALVADLFDNLIEMVNVLGSLFYGTILGIFVVAFFIKWVKGNAVFWSALIAEAFVLLIHFGRVYEIPFFMQYEVEYLWYNVIGCVLVVVISILFNSFMKPSPNLKES